MAHKADKSFFKQKRPWSERKDQILGYYLTPYFPKIATQRRPICVVDGFAGRGEFEDGKPGSPLIICTAIEQAKRRGLGADISAILIESDPELFGVLSDRVKSFSFAQVVNGRFLDQVSRLKDMAKSHSVLLYLDPFTVEGLEWAALDSIFDYLRAGQSIELLLNFNVHSFARRGLAGLQQSLPSPGDDLPGDEWEQGSAPVLEELNRIVGGDWWQSVLQGDTAYPLRVKAITDGFCARLRKRFNEVCVHEVREHWKHQVPKYVLVFCSRHPDALELMNDAMAKSRETVANESAEPNTLFEMRPESVVPTASSLPPMIIRQAKNQKDQRRRALVARVIRQAFCLFSSSEIRRAIGVEIKAGRLRSSTGKSRINDDDLVWAAD